MSDYFYDPICNKSRFNDMRKLLGFRIIEPGQTNPHKGIIYKVLCLSKIFIPAEGNGKRVHMVTWLSSECKIVLSCYVYFLDIFHWGIAEKILAVQLIPLCGLFIFILWEVNRVLFGLVLLFC